MTRFVVLGVLCLALAASFIGASASSASAAMRPGDRGSICALKLGAKGISQRSDGHMAAEWDVAPGVYGWMFWWHKSSTGAVSFTDAFPASVKAKVMRCLAAGV